MRLAKLEAAESVHRAGRGALWLGLAFGAAIVMFVAFDLFFAALFGRVANGHYWIGAMLTAALDVTGGLWLVQRGLAALKETPYSFPDTRAGLKVLQTS